LTPTGERQLYDVGVWLRQRYADDLFFDDAYIADRVRLESSAFERTIVSAQSLALGLFDAEARDPRGENQLPVQVRPNVPVFTTESRNDVVLRAYDKCPAFHDRLERLYQGTKWKSLEEDHSSLLTRLAEIPTFQPYADASGRIPLTEVWNAFDRITVAQTECQQGQEGALCLDATESDQLTGLLDDQWRELQDVAHAAELLKYGRDAAGTLVGGNLLLAVVERMLLPLREGGERRFHLYSAHYPTILGVLAALGEDPVQPDVIPGYATALIIELYEENGVKLVQVWYRPGPTVDGTWPEPVRLRLCSEAACLLDELVMYVNSSNLSVEQWCNECGNDNADVCLAASVSRLKQEEEEALLCSSVERPGLIGFFSGLAVGVLAALASWWCLNKRRHPPQPQKPPLEADTDISSSSASSAEIT
jgi:hypothetical protein